LPSALPQRHRTEHNLDEINPYYMKGQANVIAELNRQKQNLVDELNKEK